MSEDTKAMCNAISTSCLVGIFAFLTTTSAPIGVIALSLTILVIVCVD